MAGHAAQEPLGMRRPEAGVGEDLFDDRSVVNDADDPHEAATLGGKPEGRSRKPV